MKYRANLIFIIRKYLKFIFYCLTFFYFFLGIIYSLNLGNNLRYPDEFEYYKLSGNLNCKFQYTLDGKFLTAYRPPGYPFFLASLRFCGFNIAFMKIANFTFLIVILFLANNFLSKKVGKSSGLIFLFLILLYPVIFYTAGTLYPQILIAHLLVLIVILLFIKWRPIPQGMLIGLLSGILILISPLFISTFLVILIWNFHKLNQNRVKVLVSILLVSICVIGFWSLRNYFIFNSFIFVSTNGGINLLLGNSEFTEPNSGVNIDIRKYETKANELNEVEQDKYYRDKAIEYILNNKKHSIILYFQKVLNYFNFKNDLFVKSESSNLKIIIMLISYGILLLLLLGRLILIKWIKLLNIERLILIIYFSNAFFTAIFFTKIRFRIPYDILLILSLSIFLFNFLKVLKDSL